MTSAPRVLRPHGSGRLVLFCDHASNHLPAELHNLGLPAAELVIVITTNPRHLRQFLDAGSGMTWAPDRLGSAHLSYCTELR